MRRIGRLPFCLLEFLQDDTMKMLFDVEETTPQFVVVGAFAVAYHGVPRATGELDVFVTPSREALPRNEKAAGRRKDVADISRLRP